MAMKQKAIRFSYQPTPIKADHNYYCVSVQESLDYIPGERYNKAQVQELINSRNWKVTIVAPHME